MDVGAINNKLGHSFAMSIGVNAREDDCAANHPCTDGITLSRDKTAREP